MKVRLAVVRPVNTPRDGVVARRRSHVHTVKQANRVASFRTHLRAHRWDEIATGSQPFGDCAYPSRYDDFVHVADDDVATGAFSDYVTGEGYDHERANVRARLRLAGVRAR